MPAETDRWLADGPLDNEPTSARPDSVEEKPRDAQPRFKAIDRRQLFFRTVDVEALIEEDHAARAIWSVVEKLDLSGFSEEARAMEGFAGRAAIDPRLLASLWIYAYSQGIGSAREISRLCIRRTSGSPARRRSAGTPFPISGLSIRPPWRNCSSKWWGCSAPRVL
jgi:hypothetical protein